ncbi:MAG: long-chain fatty acid--CoA ligase [Candidatus Omnitrophica bacterium]|nr:long-chain fatty acid--CoA ligase [Candidatus Omnitrophota bacterium]
MTDTIPGLFARLAATHSADTLFLVKRQSAYRPVTWKQAAEDVGALSAFLLDRQVNPGDRILLLSENRPEWGFADLAIQSVGAWTVPVYASLTAEDLRVICADCQPVLGIASTADQSQKLIQVMADVPCLQAVIAMDAPATHAPRVTPWSEALARGRSLQPKLQGLLDHRMRDLRPTDTASLLYTSGTTGEPKGVMLSHANFLSNVEACLQVIPIRGHDVHLSFLPLSHVFERMAGWYLMLSIGAVIAYAENMDTIPQNMAEVRPTVMLGVPRFFEKLYARIQEALRQSPPSKRRVMNWALGVGRAVMARQAAGKALSPALTLQRAAAEALVFRKLRGKLGGRLRFFVSGSAPLSKEIGEFFYSVGLTILEGYGLTETSPVIAVSRLPTPRFGSVGPLVPGVEVWIADDGEILTRGPHVMQGYYRKPQATADVIVDGWLHTGDIGHLDDEGFLYITDRKKDLIKTAGGKFVAPQKLENLFVTDPYISQAFVYGDKQRYCVALIVPNMEQLRRYAQEQEIGGGSVKELVQHPRIQAFYWGRVAAKQAALASFEQVKKIALLEQEFSQAAGELTPTLKAKRSLIAQRHAPLLQTLYEPVGS